MIAPFALESLDSAQYESFSSMNALSLEVFHRSFGTEGGSDGAAIGRNKVTAEIKKKERLKEKLEAAAKEGWGGPNR